MSVEQRWRAALRLAACMAEYASRRGEPLHKQFDAMIKADTARYGESLKDAITAN